MRAAVRTRYGPPEVVHLVEVPAPPVGAGEVRVEVHATTVNRTDCGFRAAKPFFIRPVIGLLRPRTSILGNEFAGVVESVGPGATRFSVGDRVFGYSRRFGAHAELVSIPQDGMIAPVPAGISFEDIVPGTEGAHYALSVIRKAGIHDGQDVLVNGATGAIGSAAVQLLVDLGARVTAVCGSAHVDLVRGLGADRVIDRDAVDFTEGEDQYDVVFDAVGKSSIRRCRRVLSPRGLYLTTDLGPRAQNIYLPLFTRLGRGRRVMLPLPIENQEIVEYLRDRIASGAFRPVIDRRYSLDQIVEAYRYVETGRKVGNVVITVMPPRGLRTSG
ncbi:NAD(P)-dependent alcohol dehydrogenase [Diaminobutyricibacter sp. McL0618]|uniref:NAD(P)-dependent alcohol dehydrogenase n=1 Tax=Leifsonia sp. McL0618 TaxID=3415677 RepID=UPI003CE9079B